MRIILPMGGSGKRFKDAGYEIPKPYLSLGGEFLVQLAVESTRLLQGTYHYVVSPEVATHLLTAEVKGCLPTGDWHVLCAKTPGPLQTVLAFPDLLRGEDEMLFMDCDSFLEETELAEAIQVFRISGAEGGVTVRSTNDPICSFAKLDGDWWVEETREKDPFTSWSTTGPYWFRSGEAFLRAAQRALRAQHISISPVYNYLEGRTKAVPVATFRHLGTPEAYEAAKKGVLQLTP